MVTTTQEPIRQANPRALGFAIPGAIGLLVAFVATVVGFAALEAGGAGTKLIGADNELGLPSSAFGMVFFVIVLSIAMAEFGGATIAPGLWRALVPVLIITVLFQAWALYLGTQGGSPYWPLVLVQLACAIGALVIALLRAPRGVPNTVIGTTLVVGSVVAFFAAFRLSVDKVGTYIDPATAPSCNYSVIVQCGVNLRSWQGSLFGFPNPVLGVGGWIAVLVIGILILSGARQARWFSIALNVGMLGALTLVGWLIYQSIFRLGTLCPWCMTTWAMTIPLFWLVTFHNLKEGVFTSSERVKRVFKQIYGFTPLVTLLSYLLVLVLAQVGLDLLSFL
ncbi:MAG: vitamin K epoxide reductase family protein [Actinomycetota bacterium]